MVTVPSSNTDFNGYYNTLKEVDDRLRAYKFRNPKSGQVSRSKVRQKSPQSNWRASPQEDIQMDWTPTRPAQVAAGKRAKWVSSKELQRRKEQNLYIRCGAPGYRIAQCHYQPAKRPNRSMKVTQVQAYPQLEEEESVSKSEN
ncbi:hypothetical protein M501DRAFT_1015069 [Patellaria atrata CBS 101060]|uniref:Uncharacterized protein n=1 Tax=Patellaria atrata CBS 101060 TaxID=1346257 RepID=A0A9P4SFZ3_9PEZI|nr:hypothetical protein M501DRAFT_1015069 [Patellaria atrata CBS 101060]